MPGIFGIMAKSRIDEDRLRQLAKTMALAMFHTPWLREEYHTGKGFVGGKVALPSAMPGLDNAPKDMTQIVIFDGYIYHRSSQNITPDACFLGTEWLVQNDGAFQLATFDSDRNILTIATDKFGLRPLFYVETGSFFAFASEVKCLLSIVPEKRLDLTALKYLLSFGYILGNRTIWEGISRIPPSTRCIYDGTNLSQQQYWNFPESVMPLPEGEIIEELKRLWSDAVAQSVPAGVSPVLLSGGLDSRFLVGEMSRQGFPIHAITFGSKESSDPLIAKQVVNTLNVPHTIHLLDDKNWLEGREQAIWQTDSGTSLLHLAAASATQSLRIGNHTSPMNFMGDLIFGGSFLQDQIEGDWQDSLPILLKRFYITNPMVRFDEVIDSLKSEIEVDLKGTSSDCFWLRQRAARFTINGPIVTSSYAEATYPSMSTDLVEFIYSHTIDEQRRKSRLYNKLLTSSFPKLFSNIRWQKTGRGLQESKGVRLYRSIINRLGRDANRYAPGVARYDDLVFKYADDFVASSKVFMLDQLAETCLVDLLKENARNRNVLNRQSMETCAMLCSLEIYLRRVMGTTNDVILVP